MAMYSARDPSGESERDNETKEPGDVYDENRATEQTVERKATEMANQLASTINVKNSEVFSKTMHEFQLRKQQHLERLAAAQRDRDRRAEEELAEGKEKELQDTIKEEDEIFDSDWSDDEVVVVQDTATLLLRQTAARAWGIVRRHVQEVAMEKKKKSTAMSWNFLRQTIAHMTDMEKGRQNLYERYLYKPDAWKDGFTNFPSELLNKEKGRGRRGHVPPTSAKPKNKQTNAKKSPNIKSNGNMVIVKSH